MLAKRRHPGIVLGVALGGLIGLIAVAGPLTALVQPDLSAVLNEKIYQHQELHVPSVYTMGAELPDAISAGPLSDLAALGTAPESAYMDERTGRWGTLMPRTPLLPGPGVGNDLTWESLGRKAPKSRQELKAAALDLFADYLRRHEDELKVSVDEMARPGRVEVHDGGRLIQIHVPRVVDGVPVRNSALTAVINSGNLVLWGTRNWADVKISTRPTLTLDEAHALAYGYLGNSLVSSGYWTKPYLTLVPAVNASFLREVPFGQGLGYRLAWVVNPRIDSNYGSWEVLVDAHSGQVLQFLDTNDYQSTRTLVGGVYPNSNDGTPPDGVEQPFWPMPFADMNTPGGDLFYTDSGGNLLACVDGFVGTTLNGQFMNMNDDCGELTESGMGDINLGTSGGDDCTVPPGGSDGNTHASRSGFYEMNRMKELARGQLPDNLWLHDQLTANMNINQSCNAFWNGITVNFYRSGGGCGNTGELAGVYDHEWGHGMDSFGVAIGIANPGEDVADIYASLRLNDACVGRGFLSGNCSGYGDPCIDCTGVRVVDWERRQSGEPHGADYANNTCTFQAGGGPCGNVVHCEGSLLGETSWDLYARDLQGGNFNWDSNTSLELATQLAFQGLSPMVASYNCNQFTEETDGCNADGAYLNYLAADDDNGDLNDGTPHMTAIAMAFNRHDIACTTPFPVDFGCEGGPIDAPVVTATPIDRGVQLSWGAVAGATKYAIYRADGVFQCDIGKVKVGETTDLEFVDDGLLNIREYYYTVAAIGPSGSCLGPMSSCTTVNPAAGPNLAISPGSDALTVLTGDGDEFLDNCEEARFDFDLINIGDGTLSNVEIVAVESPSHPNLTVTSQLPIPVTDSLSACGSAAASFDFLADGLGFQDNVEIRVDFTGDELGGLTRSATLSVSAVESDFAPAAEKTFAFEESEEDWTTVLGTFELTDVGGGANGTAQYFTSSQFLDQQCDQVVSPVVRLNPTSTLSLWSNFDIEPFCDQCAPPSWYDRGNIGILASDGTRTLINPDGGRMYNADGPNGTCGTEGQDGFADSMPTWGESTFSTAVLSPFAGELVQISINYGTDPFANGAGFWFDEVTLTDIELQGPDSQSDVCAGIGPNLNITGSCPGQITMEVTGGTPAGPGRFFWGSGPGQSVINSGPCAGETVDLENVRLLASGAFDANGEILLSREAGVNQCGRYVQVFDETTCGKTQVVQLPQ